MSSATTLDRCSLLRQELKQWENSFAANNGGRKAGRDEIKQDVVIAAKYKEYNRLRAGPSKPSSAISPPQHSIRAPTSPSKRSRTSQKQHVLTPQKRRQQHTTPRKQKRRVPSDSGVEFPTSEAADQDQEEQDENATPVVKRLFVGPTPQKNGRVLGLFDLLSPEKPAIITSPSKPSPRAALPQDSPSKPRPIFASLDANLVSNDTFPAPSLTTPRKRTHSAIDVLEPSDQAQPGLQAASSPLKHSRTPQSASKRYLLDTFITPSKRRRLSTSDTETPSHRQIAAGEHETPAFLRRDSQRLSFAALDDVLEEDEDEADDGEVRDRAGHDDVDAEDGFDPSHLYLQSPSKSRQQRARPSSFPTSRFGLGARMGGLRRTGSIRTLSSMIADMRKAEDERLDEEMDLLREMEDPSFSFSASGPTASKKQAPKVLVEDSQLVDAGDGVLGPDGEGDDVPESEGEEDVNGNGQPRRVWKKKGAKRQTRRVLMRPVAARKPLTREKIEGRPEVEDGDEDEDELGAGAVVGTAAGQDDAAAEHGASDEDDGEEEDEYDDDDNDDDFQLIIADDSEHDNSQSQSKPTQPTAKTAAASKSQAATNKPPPAKDGVVKKAVKKIKATANANFCKLKIRSAKGAAGAKGLAFKRRFGKGRR